MGRPYIKELRELKKTYSTISKMDVSRLEKAVLSSANSPLYVIGSGGSLSAAHFVTFLHQRLAGQFAKAVTPMEATEFLSQKMNSAFWCMSAGGRNSDINNAFRRIVLQEPKCLITTCARTDSPLAQLGKRYEYTDVFEFDLPSRRDGFLATNSLLAFSLLSARAYQQFRISKQDLPKNMWDLIAHKGPTDRYLSKLRNLCSILLERKHIIALFDPSTKPAAYDLESKFTEAALGSVSLADFRNFAHGRHHWIAKHSDTSAVLTFTTDRSRELARKTVNLLPANVPVVQLHFAGHDTWAAVAALIAVLHIVALGGEKRSIDPGRPSVPSFGRKLYHLRGVNKKPNLSMSRMALATRRKASVLGEASAGELSKHLGKAYNKFIRTLGKKSFAAVVFDYDGTLCGKENRFGDFDSRISKELRRILKAGILVGIATGRGKSARIALQKALPKSLWPRILVGYYNGADLGILYEDTKPDGTDIPCPELESLAAALRDHPAILTQCYVTVRKYQITIEALPTFRLNQVFSMVFELAQQHGAPGTQTVSSSHSIDILAPGVSKLSVIETLYKCFSINAKKSILCIGDRGLWPGNDFELLKTEFSLSVDEVSGDLATCWNIAPAGYRGIQATLFYLKCIRTDENTFHFNLSQSRRLAP